MTALCPCGKPVGAGGSMGRAAGRPQPLCRDHYALLPGPTKYLWRDARQTSDLGLIAAVVWKMFFQAGVVEGPH